MLRIHFLLLVALGFLGASCAIAANLIAVSMVNKVNEKLPPSDQMSYMSWDWSIRRKFKGLYPNDNLVRYFDLCVVLVVIGFFLVLFWVFG